MTLRDIKKLDLMAIKGLLQKLGESETEKLELLYKNVLRYINQFGGEEISPIFFEGKRFTAREIEAIGEPYDLRNVLCYLINHRIVPINEVLNLALSRCNTPELCAWANEGLIDANYLIEKLIDDPDLVRYAIEGKLQGIDFESFVEKYYNYLGAKAEFFLHDIENIFRVIEHLEYTRFHCSFLDLLYRKTSDNADVQALIKPLLSKFLDNDVDLVKRPDVAMLVRWFLQFAQPTLDEDNELLEKVEKKKDSTHNKYLTNSICTDIAFYDYLFPFSYDDVFLLVNHWAADENEIAFRIYSGYFLSDNRDYERIGKALDGQYEKELNAVRQRRRIPPKKAQG